MNKNVLAIRERFSHMGDFSGYDQLFKHLETDHCAEANLISIWKEDKPARDIENRIFSKIKSLTNGTPYYVLNSFKAELKAFWRLFNNNPDVVHIAYIENNLGLGKWYKKLANSKIIATVHQPPSWWQTGIANPNLVSVLDKLIVLDTHSKEYFSKYLDPEKIHLIRHGVDTNFFKALEKITEGPKPRFNCLFTGQWLRDIELLLSVIKYVNSKKHSQIYFDIVYPVTNQSNNIHLKRFSCLRNTFIYNNLSDVELKKLYQDADIFLIPLIDSTANNSILEAMASGLPIITTPVGGICDYVTDDFAFLSHSAQQMGDHIIELFKNPKEVKIRSNKALQYTEANLSWEFITKRTIHTYNL